MACAAGSAASAFMTRMAPARMAAFMRPACRGCRQVPAETAGAAYLFRVSTALHQPAQQHDRSDTTEDEFEVHLEAEEVEFFKASWEFHDSPVSHWPCHGGV